MSTGRAIGYTSLTGGAVGGAGSAAGDLLEGKSIDPLKLVVETIGGGVGAGVGARIANSASVTLSKMSAAGGVMAGVADTTRSSVAYGTVELGGGLGQAVGTFTIDAFFAGLTKWTSKSLSEKSETPLSGRTFEMHDK